MKTAPALAALLVELGSGTYGSVCVALGSPEDDRSAVTGSVPSAMLKWLIVRLKSWRDAIARSFLVTDTSSGDRFDIRW